MWPLHLRREWWVTGRRGRARVRLGKRKEEKELSFFPGCRRSNEVSEIPGTRFSSVREPRLNICKGGKHRVKKLRLRGPN